jgi:hypothetical protein
MDDQKFGKRNKRGDFIRNAPAAVAPVFVWPPRPLKFLAWLPHYFLPWNALFMALGLIMWLFLTPSKETLQTLDWHWIVYLLLRNSALVFVLYGLLELRLYIRRARTSTTSSAALAPASRSGRRTRWACFMPGRMAGALGRPLAITPQP